MNLTTLFSFFGRRTRPVTRSASSELLNRGTGHLPVHTQPRSNPPTYRSNPLNQQSNPPTYRSLPSYRAQNNQDQLVLRGQDGLSEEDARISSSLAERLLYGGVREDDHDVPAFLLEDTFTPQRSHQPRQTTTSRPSVFDIFPSLRQTEEASQDAVPVPPRAIRRQRARLNLGNMYNYLPE